MYPQQPQVGQIPGGQDFQTAADLRRQLHTMKSRDREINMQVGKSPGDRFLKSNWFSGLVTGAAVFVLLYITNPTFVHASQQEQAAWAGNEDRSSLESKKYLAQTPSLKRITAWAVLSGLLVALGPLAYQKFSS
jgi:hypothetical protein